MNFLKRSFISMIRNCSKILPLFFAVFVVGNLLCSAVAIKQTTLNTKKQFEKAFGTKIIFDYKNGYQNIGYEENNIKYKNLGAVFKEIDQLDIYSYSNISYFSNSLVSQNVKYQENENIYYEYENMPLFIWGIDETIPIDEKEYDIELVDGRTFTQTELNHSKHVVVLSENFKITKDSKIRNIGIGDVVFIENEPFEVIGIYKRSKNVQIEINGYNEDNNCTRIYMPLGSLDEITTNINHIPVPIKAFFQLNDIEDTDLFMENYASFTKGIQIPDDFYIMKSTELFEKIGAPIESLSNISSYILVTTEIIMILILMLFVFLIMKNRKHEIGILYALGERKYKIILQFIFEIYLVGLLALSCSTITGCKLGQCLSTTLMNIDNKEELTIKEKQEQLHLIEMNQVDYSIEYFGQVFVACSLAMIISIGFPISYILRFEPKKILM